VNFWGADEELLLLEGIEIYGLGNWGDVSDHVGTKLPPSCKDHYFKTYINVPTAPLPDLTQVLTSNESLLERNRQGRGAMTKQQDPSSLEEDDEVTAKKQAHTKVSSSYSVPELAGYMTNRGDFETEYENEAESVCCDVAFNEDDTQVERELKLRILEIYNQKLDERIRRKNFIVERGLLDYKKNDKKRSKEDKELWDRTRVFSRLLTKEEYEEFVNGMIVERKLRQRI